MNQPYTPMLKLNPQRHIYLRFIIFLVPVFLYLNTIRNEYALDDSIVITQNIYVRKGVEGIREIFSTETFTGFFRKKKELVQGGRYRPLSVASFAIENGLWGEKPGISHLINAILYGLFCLVLFKVLCHLINHLNPKEKNISSAFIATLIFAALPIHTEVVANIKGRDEILAGLFFLLSFHYLMKTTAKDAFRTGGLAGIFLFLALLSKENAFALIPVALLFYLLKEGKIPLKDSGTALLFLFAAAFIYGVIRYRVVGSFSGVPSGELMNNPFLEARHGEKIPTIIYTLLLYLKLLVFPYPLTYDYYPYHIALKYWSDPLVIISVILHIGIVCIGIYHFRRNRIIAFAIFFYFILLLPVSNLLVNIGSFMNERFLFLPSIGFSLLAGSVLSRWIMPDGASFQIKKTVAVLLLPVLIIFCGITVKRNTVWKNNLTLFTHDVKISSGSAKGNCAAGGILYETSRNCNVQAEKKDMLNQSIIHLEKAISIYPGYTDALLLLGNAHYELNRDMKKVLKYYAQIIAKTPGYDLAYQNLNKMLASSDDPVIRIKGYTMILSVKPESFEANYHIGVTYGKMLGQLDSAIIYLSRSVQMNPENELANRDLGVAYAMSNRFQESLLYFKKVVQIDPDDPDNLINLGITYNKTGQADSARAMFSHAESIKNRKQ